MENLVNAIDDLGGWLKEQEEKQYSRDELIAAMLYMTETMGTYEHARESNMDYSFYDDINKLYRFHISHWYEHSKKSNCEEMCDCQEFGADCSEPDYPREN